MMIKGFQSRFKVVDRSAAFSLSRLQPNHNKTYSTNSSRLNFVYKLIMVNRKSINLFGGQISVFGGQITLFGESLFYLFRENWII